ncbi:MAG: FAD-dependent thymidylate synthase [Patescibacteria group bacterium]|jgi:thymidylate synthase ThyX
MPKEILSNERDIFAITGLPPEVLAVGMAKYSRSAASIKDTIAELTEEKSAEFHEKWVIGYGDASVADMAVIALACENVSILASKAIEDHRLASYQEKSTRYISFERQVQPDGSALPRRYYRPTPIAESAHAGLYERTCEQMFDAYSDLTQTMVEYYRREYPMPADGKEKLYTAKLKARALDIARYVLPAATLTNLGWITSARSLRRAIFKMGQSDLDEVRKIASEVQHAATSPAHNPQAQKVEPLLWKAEEQTDPIVQELVQNLRANLNLTVKGAPTLIKHTEPTPFAAARRRRIRAMAATLLGDLHVLDNEPRVTFHPHVHPEVELATSLLYEETQFSYGQIQEVVMGLSAAERAEVIAAGTADRGSHDLIGRPFEVGNLVFDTLMDYGAFRDLQRHRMCTQINQPLTAEHGFEKPPAPMGMEAAGALDIFETVFQEVQSAYRILAADFPHEAAYVLPLATRKRTLFSMNARELTHLVELRSRSGGHVSYRWIVRDMLEQAKAHYPELVRHIRIADIDFVADFHKR